MSAGGGCDVLIAGGGPAGMMAGLLFARAGLDTVVAEKHADFLRDFRGDTVHPSTMEIFNRLGLLQKFLQRPHERMERIGVRWRGERLAVADLTGLKVAAPFVAFMPQWEFLDFVASEARRLPNFRLLMNAEAGALIEAQGSVRGLRIDTPDGRQDMTARLTVAADGRGSRLRELAGLPMRTLGAPVDVLWFRLPRTGAARGEDSLINAAPGTMVITIDRGDYWQCAFVIPKSGLEAVRAEGLDRLAARVAEAAPQVAGAVGALRDWNEVKLLSVAVDRLERWSRPGLLAIGDAAHAMSPVGGVGINLAIQDAVAAANLLAPRLRAGTLSAEDLDLVRCRRLWPTRLTQFVQVQVQNRLLAPIVAGRADNARAPLPLRIANAFPPLRRLLAYAIGIGVRPENVDPAILAGAGETSAV